MIIKGRKISFKQLLCIIIYYSILYYLPSSTFIVSGIGRLSKKLRYLCCRHIFLRCGNNVNIERKANFGCGLEIEIGDNSGIGINSTLPCDTKIGKNVMMGPNCYILASNHSFDRTDIPMIEQGFSIKKQTLIEDDVWIGRNVIMTPGRTIKQGTIIGAGCVLCKDFPSYSIVGGNPSKIIKTRNR